MRTCSVASMSVTAELVLAATVESLRTCYIGNMSIPAVTEGNMAMAAVESFRTMPSRADSGCNSSCGGQYRRGALCV